MMETLPYLCFGIALADVVFVLLHILTTTANQSSSTASMQKATFDVSEFKQAKLLSHVNRVPFVYLEKRGVLSDLDFKETYAVGTENRDRFEYTFKTGAERRLASGNERRYEDAVLRWRNANTYPTSSTKH